MRIYFFGVCVKVNSSLLNAILFRIHIKEKYIDFAERKSQIFCMTLLMSEQYCHSRLSADGARQACI